MGSTGDPLVPVGDPPTGRARRFLPRDASLLIPGALPVPPGESPGGTEADFAIKPTDSWIHTAPEVEPEQTEQTERERQLGSASERGRRGAVTRPQAL